MSVPEHQLDPFDSLPCYQCLVREVGEAEAWEIQQQYDEPFGLCLLHARRMKDQEREDRMMEGDE